MDEEDRKKLLDILLDVSKTEESILRLMIIRAKMKVREAQSELNKLIWECSRRGHVVTKREKSGGAYCAICRIPLGWWCPKSPDHLCHYPNEEGYEKYENVYWENCVFCGEPNERK